MKKALSIVLSLILIMALSLSSAAISIIKVKSIKLNINQVSMLVGESVNLKVTFTPANTTQKKLTYATGNKAIASIDVNGKITAVGTGTTIITVSTPNKAVYAKCTVTVTKPVQKSAVKYYTRSMNGNDSKLDNEMVHKLVEEKSGVKIEVIGVPQDAYQDKINLMIASGEEFDAFDFTGFGGFTWTEFLDRKALMPINDLIDRYGPNIRKQLGDGFGAVSKGGKMYGLPRQEDFPSGFVPVIRKDWLEKSGITIKTMADLEKYFEAVLNNDFNGNGKKDEIPYIPSWGFGGIESNFKPYFVGETSERYLDKATNKIMPIYAHPGYKAMILKMAEWYKKGYLYKEFITVKSQQISDLYIANRVGLTSGFYSGHIKPMIQLRKTTPTADAIPLPVLTDGKFAGYGSNPVYSPKVMVSATSKNAEWLIKYIDWQMSSKENYHTSFLGVKGAHWYWADTKKTTVILPEKVNDKYTGFYDVVSAFTPDLRPVYAVNSADSYKVEETKLKKILRSAPYKFVSPFDSYVPYTNKGTKAEILTGDGKTMIEEARTKLIFGEITAADFDVKLAKYMEIEGNIRSEVYTKQYWDYVGK